MYNLLLCRIIRRLQLWNFNNMPTHIRRRYETALPKRRLELLAIKRRLLLLFPILYYQSLTTTP
jgi:hypothetical protein